jgi:hypothetical protein
MAASVDSPRAEQARDSALDFAEPALIAPQYVSGIAYAKVIGGVLHVAYYTEQPTDNSTIERVITTRLVYSVQGEEMMRTMIDGAIAEAIRKPQRAVS